MLFRLLHGPLCFEIPDDWWQRSGAASFSPQTECYSWFVVPGAVASVVAPLASVAPMLRLPGVERQAFGFRDHGLETEKGGLPDVLEAMVAGVPLPAVTVCLVRKSREGFSFKLRNGFHRFYASHALRFTHLPCSLVPDEGEQPNFGEL